MKNLKVIKAISALINNLLINLCRISNSSVLFVDFREFICSLSLTTRGKVEDKLLFAFKIYDVNGDGKLTIEEIKSIIKTCEGLKNNPEEKLQEDDLYNIFKSIDANNDGHINYAEFKYIAMKNPTLLKVLNENTK